ncbi:MAG: TIGR01212 family radical SAM protein, partial [SAR324 cluster bacterium]|nr:TIGR01212 family radical SAM protein [SAR324 cluster bacterium]
MRYTQADVEGVIAPMMTFPDENGHRYYSINRFYRQQFGEKVYKIAVSVANSCPNRHGADGSGCIFCDEWGSAGVHQTMDLTLEEQIVQNRANLKERYRINKFLVYFQAFSNTYTQISELKSNMELALSQQQIYGIIVGTRPDCLSPDVFELFRHFAKESFISVELGVQSFNNERLRFLKRGHTAEQSIEAIQALHEKSGVHVGIHLIFGLPDESNAEIIETARLINELPVDSVKLHN